MTKHYIVGTVEERELKDNKLIGVRFRIKRNEGTRHANGEWSPGQALKPGDLPELSYIFDMTEDEAEGLMVDIGVKLSNIRKERNGSSDKSIERL